MMQNPHFKGGAVMPSPKKILLVDDSSVNRQILTKILGTNYLTLEAENGETALSVLKKHGDTISAVLLDIVMPVMDGYEVLKEMRCDPIMSQIPVIVASGQDSDDAEIKALSLGAYDYILKPYKPEIIRHRIANTIYLRETAAFVNSVQNDPLTGLYSKEYFYLHAGDVLKNNPDKKYDLLCCDIERFKLVNDLYGTKAGDKLLKYVGEMICEAVADHGICGRIGSDIFAFLIEHQESYENSPFIKKTESINVANINLNIILRYGIYFIDDTDIPINIACDRASLAKNSIKGKYETYFAHYDDTSRQKLLNEQFITSNMKNALDSGQFNVYFQPKYNLKTENVAGCEALVRWIHPERGIMSPAEFIPLFEKNGFITDLDIYIWEQCCKKMREWLDGDGFMMPISVNVSRADVYNPQLPDILTTMIKKYHLSPSYLHLEITETAYTENPEQLINAVSKLKKLGFVIEMDDFGTGYSSLNMLSELPIDVLKLDIKFIQNEEKKSHNKSILSFIINLAKWLDLTVIAEGVETGAQIELLKALDCEYVQGYYYAKPLPLGEFEDLMNKSAVQPSITAKNQRPLIKTVQTGETTKNIIVMLDSIGDDYAHCEKFCFGDFKIIRAQSCAEVIACLREHKEQTAVSVINRADITDPSQIKELQALCHNIGTSSLILSDCLDETVTEALEIGIFDYLLRPYNEAAFLHRTENVICRSQAAQYQREKELGKVAKEMKRSLEEDTLTKLLNRVAFNHKVESFFQRNKRNLQCALIMVDIDDFEKINDQFGYIIGDKVICSVADILSSLFTDAEYISRIGENSYAVFAPRKLDRRWLKDKIEQMRRALSVKINDMQITCSVSVAQSPSCATDPETLYKNAETALHAAKKSGKNRCVFFKKGMTNDTRKNINEHTAPLLDNVSDAMFVCEAKTNKIIYINETACHILRKDKKECLGERCCELFWSRKTECERCAEIGKAEKEYYEEDTMLADNITPVRIKAKTAVWNDKKVKIHYLQNIGK